MKNPFRRLAVAAILSLFTLYSSLFAASGGALDTRGIPADVQGLIHIDYAQLSKSTLGTGILQQADQKEYEAIKTQYGFDPAKDITAVTIGLIKSAYGTPAFFGVARGKFSPEKIAAAAKQAGARVTTKGKYAIIEGLNLNIPIPFFSQQNAFTVLDSNTILFAQTKSGLAKAIAAHTGEAKSYAAPAALDKLRKQTATPLALGYLDSNLTPDAYDSGMMSIPKADSVYFSATEDAQNLLARIYADFASPDDAEQLQGTLQMFTGFMQMAAAKAGGSGKQADQARMMQKLLSSLQVNLDGNTLALSITYSTADVLKAIQTYSEKFKAAAAAR